MIVKVKMLAFMDGEIRNVEIPDDTPDGEFLGAVFKLGQNMFQPVPNRCSVSVNDVILDERGPETKYVRVAGCGFQEMSKDEFDKFEALDKESRARLTFK